MGFYCQYLVNMDKTFKISFNSIRCRIQKYSRVDILIAVFTAISCGFLIRLMNPASPIPANQMSLYPLKIVQVGIHAVPSKGCDIEIIEIKVNNGKISLREYANDAWHYTGNSLINRTCKEDTLPISLNSRLNDIEILLAATPTSGIVKILPLNPKQPIDLYAPDAEQRIISFKFYPRPQPSFLQTINVYPQFKEIIIAQKNLIYSYASQAIVPSMICLIAIFFIMGVWPVSANEGRWRYINLLMAAVIIDVISLAFITGMALGIPQKGGGRYQLYSIPDAVSRHDFGLGGYLFYEGVQAASAEQAVIQMDIETIRNVQSLDRTKVNYYDADDKGTGDFALLSFLIFGWNISSLYYGWFGLFILSNLVYIITYLKNIPRLYTLLILNISIYAALYLIVWANNIDGICDPRVSGICVFPGLLQILFFIIDRQKPSLITVSCVLIQILTIIFCIHMRTSDLWQILCVCTFAILIYIISYCRDKANRGEVIHHLSWHLNSLWPALILIIMFGGLLLYQHFAYKAYTEKQLQRHIFWHNFVMGFSFQPELREKYKLEPTDMGVVDLVNQYLREKGIDEKVHWHSPQRYEEVVKEVGLTIIRRHPKQVLSLFIYHKPLIFIQMGLYAIGATDTVIASKTLGPYFFYPNYVGFQMFHLKYNPFRPEALLFLFIGLFVLVMGRRLLTWETLTIAIWACLWSLLPGWLIYPILHIIVPAIILSGFFVLAVLSWMIGGISTRLIYSPKVES